VIVRLSLTLDSDRRAKFLRLFQDGVDVYAKTGCSIRSFLCDQLGIDPRYVSERILAIFLNGRPVDDVDGAFVQAGSTLSLSAAVPGLAGATVRRGGTYACLRSSITHRETGTRPTCAEGTIRLKLFNMVAKELGPRMLEGGVLTSRSELRDILSGLPEDVLRGSSDILLDGKPFDRRFLEVGDRPGRESDTILLTIRPKSVA